jgi:hypothetical protein
LNELLVKVREKDVPNLGHIGCIIGHMMQTVTSTTLRMEPFLYQDLGRLLYGPNIRRFNMFFLDSLDLNSLNVLSEACIPATDDAYVHRHLGSVIKPTAQKRRNGLQLATSEALSHSNKSLDKVTWATIKNILETSPHRLIKKYVWPAHLTVYLHGERDTLRGAAGSLFIMLTQSLWTILKDTYKLDPLKKIDIPTLQDAIRFWSLDNIQAVFQSPFLQAISTEGTGTAGRHREDFGSEEQVGLYFGTGKGGGWQCLKMTVGMTYVQTVIAHPGADKEKQLKGYLGELLSACQFLPDSNKSRVWTHTQGRIIVNSNPRYWNLNAGDVAGRGTTLGTSQRQGPVHKGEKEFMADMLRMENPEITSAQLTATYKAWQASKKLKEAPKKAKQKTVVNCVEPRVTRSKVKAVLRADDADWSPDCMSDNTE